MAEIVQFRFPTDIRFGAGARAVLSEFAQKYKVGRPLLVTDTDLVQTQAYRLIEQQMMFQRDLFDGRRDSFQSPPFGAIRLRDHTHQFSLAADNSLQRRHSKSVCSHEHSAHFSILDTKHRISEYPKLLLEYMSRYDVALYLGCPFHYLEEL